MESGNAKIAVTYWCRRTPRIRAWYMYTSTRYERKNPCCSQEYCCCRAYFRTDRYPWRDYDHSGCIHVFDAMREQ